MVMNLWYRPRLGLASRMTFEPKYRHHLVQNHSYLAQKRIFEHDEENIIL